MKLRLVSHASVVFRCCGSGVWTDPWLFGKAFNNSWTLLPPPVFDQSLLTEISHIWISHEHPDHFNLPTLGSLPLDFKRRVVVLFQDNNPERIFESLRRIGYRNFTAMPHRRAITIHSDTRVYCYRAGTLDSCLAVVSGGKVVLDVNDARINHGDCKKILKDLGHVDVVLNQFSLAVHNGDPDHCRCLKRAAYNILEEISANHRDLKAEATIPFASLIYYSTTDNRFMNAYANRPRDVFEFCRARGQRVEALYPGDEYAVGGSYDSSRSLANYEAVHEASGQLVYDSSPPQALEAIRESFEELVRRLRQRFPRLLLNRVKPLRICVPDLELAVELSIARGTLTVYTGGSFDAVISSQPLHYWFSHPWCFQTLTISARFTVLRRLRTWHRHKALFALYAAGVNLRPSCLLSRSNREFF